MNLSLIRARQAQRGSTFLGIILGVVVVGAIVWFIRRKREQGQGG